MEDPARTQLPAGTHRLSIESGGLPREALVHVPERLRGPAPLVVVLHGRGGTALYARAVTGFSDKADEQGFVVLYPEAIRADPRRPVHLLNNPTLWNDGSTRRLPGRELADDVGFMSELLDVLAGQVEIDARRVFVTGFSNGGAMAFRLGVDLSQRIAAIAPVACTLWRRDVPPSRPVSLLCVTGAADPLNPVEGGEYRTPWDDWERKPPLRETLALWARWCGCSETPQPLLTPPGVRGERYGPGPSGAEIIAYVVDGAGHVWPGGRSVLVAPQAGGEGASFNATDVIWGFFRSRPAARGTG